MQILFRRRNHKEEHFERLFAEMYPRLVRFATTLMSNTEEAKDIVSETMEQAWKEFDQLKENTRSAWLYATVRNGCLNRLKHLNVEQQHIDRLIEATRAEMNRQISMLEEKHSNFISQKVDSLFGCDIWLPAELANSKTGKDFFWASTNTGTADRNFVMYSYPYTDKETFTKEYFVHKRDSVMKANIPGFKEGVYMSTDSLLTDVRPINVQNSYTMEARGLWRMKGDFMGGPYVSHTRLDEKNQRIITAEIFVYSPDKMKRNLVRQMEASLYTLKLPNEVQQNQIPLGGAAKEAEQTNK